MARPYIFEERALEIARLLDERGVGQAGPATRRQRRELRKRGLSLGPSARELGPGEAPEVQGLRALILEGLVEADEADAYLYRRYPDRQWARARWGSSARSRAVGKAGDDILAGSSDQEGMASAIGRTFGGTREGGSPPDSGSGERSIVVDELPGDYDAVLLNEQIQRVADQATDAIEEIQRGEGRYLPNTIPGEALRPGSLDRSRFSVEDEASGALDPGPEDAIGLELGQATLDRWADDGTRAGPARVMACKNRILPAGRTVSRGAQRFRVLTSGMRLGVLSLVHESATSRAAATANNTLVTYGLVIAGIPHDLGRPPQRIVDLAWVGDSPVPLVGDNGLLNPAGTPGYNGLGDNAEFFLEIDEVDFQSAPPRMFVPFDDVGTGIGPLVPTQTYADTVQGIQVGIPTGTTAKHIRAQMNGRTSTWFRSILGDAPMLHASVPRDLPWAPPATGALIYVRFTAGAIQDYVSVDEAAFFDPAETRYKPIPTHPSNTVNWIHGVPFRESDCRDLAPTDKEFSVVIQISPPRAVVSGVIANGDPVTAHPDLRLSAWGRVGLEVVEQSGRAVGLDVIVA